MNRELVITNARVVTPDGLIPNGWLLVQDGRIASIGAGDVGSFDIERIDAGGATLLPGFIDVHVHGAVGCEAMDATPDALREMSRFYAQHGVTSCLPTTWTESRARITAALRTIAEMVGQQPDGATILGAHVEGPYLNPERSGAQNTVYIRRADREEAAEWLDTGVVRLLALAPEYEANHWLIEDCARRGIVVSAAHTAASYDQMRRAVHLGLTQTTHTYNAMTGLNHREPGTVGAAMTSPEISCELIADGIHVHPVAMQILAMTKGLERIILISDAVRGAGMPDGEYSLDGRIITIRSGVCRLPDGTLAGSTLTMERALQHFCYATGYAVETAWRAASLNAARALHIDDQKGSLVAGKDADLVLIGDDFNVLLTVAEGRVVYRRTGDNL